MNITAKIVEHKVVEVNPSDIIESLYKAEGFTRNYKTRCFLNESKQELIIQEDISRHGSAYWQTINRITDEEKIAVYKALTTLENYYNK